MGKVVPVCFFCQQIPEQGFAGGIFLFSKFLCEQCQDKILEVSSEDADYEHVLGKIKELWHQHPQEKRKLINQKY